MQRYFVRIKYRGTGFSGWQSQPNAHTVQDAIEEAMQKFLGTKIPIVGCGRTDAGVHASDFYFHFDFVDLNTKDFVYKLNSILTKEIAILKAFSVQNNAHARFDAIKRSYIYHIHCKKDPFKQGLSYFYPQLLKYDLEKLNIPTTLFTEYKDFFPFCKTKTDVKTTVCNIYESRWEKKGDRIEFHISADRFLRGMVRLMVGCCINFVTDKLSANDIETAFRNRTRLRRDLSVPAEGLYLNEIVYPNSIRKEETTS